MVTVCMNPYETKGTNEKYNIFTHITSCNGVLVDRFTTIKHSKQTISICSQIWYDCVSHNTGPKIIYYFPNRSTNTHDMNISAACMVVSYLDQKSKQNIKLLSKKGTHGLFFVLYNMYNLATNIAS